MNEISETQRFIIKAEDFIMAGAMPNNAMSAR
jgi:hypothetical protein